MVEQDRFGAEIVDEGDDWAQVAIQGPKGVEVVQQLVDFDAAAVARHQFRIATFAGVKNCIVARTGYTGRHDR
jgi:aminomethyltransferase